MNLVVRHQVSLIVLVNFNIFGINYVIVFTAKSHEEKYPVARWKRNMLKQETKKRLTSKDSEIKRPEQIARERFRLELIKNRERVNKKIKDSNRKRSAKKQKKK